MKSSDTSFFSTALLGWYQNNHRPLPWKGIKDPYLIWLSEIILQQTRVATGWAYFERFREQYPTVHHLADAPIDEVMKLWEGLGYYSRARNLHFTAQYISRTLGGTFPNTYKDILQLKGVGPYTAAAIASFAFGLPVAVVDGNVYRVLSRVFGMRDPIDSGAGKKKFAELANLLLDKDRPADYNQAIMDFGATVCTPGVPNCHQCPFEDRCLANAEGTARELPVKSKKLVRKTRYFNYLVFQDDQGHTLLEKRSGRDIWQGLYQFPMLESKSLLEGEDILGMGPFSEQAHLLRVNKISLPFRQVLTHQNIIAQFADIRLKSLEEIKKSSYLMVEKKNLDKFAFPKVIDRYLHPQENLLF